MENLQGVNSAQNVQFQGARTRMPEQNYVSKPQQIENGDEKLKKALIGLGVIGATGIALAVALKKGKAKINYNKGIATIGEEGEKFSGKIVDKLKNGDKVTRVYKDGVLQSSQRAGKVNFEKIYTTNESGEKIVKKIVDGAEQEVNITKKVNETKDSIQKLKDKISSASADPAMSKGAAQKVSLTEVSNVSQEAQASVTKAKTEITQAIEKNRLIESEQEALKKAQAQVKSLEERIAKLPDGSKQKNKLKGHLGNANGEVTKHQKELKRLGTKQTCRNLVKICT